MSNGLSSELCGKYDHKLDPKNRVAIPSEWRCGDECPVVLLESSKEGYPMVKVTSPEQFRAWVDEIRNSDRPMGAKNRYVGRMYAECLHGVINAQGKLLVPKKMCTRLELDADIKLVARGNFFELWKPESFTLADQIELATLEEMNEVFDVF